MANSPISIPVVDQIGLALAPGMNKCTYAKHTQGSVCIKKIFLFYDPIVRRVARFFFRIPTYQNGRNIPNERKIWKMALNYPNILNSKAFKYKYT
jgi:hypothetical protein